MAPLSPYADSVLATIDKSRQDSSRHPKCRMRLLDALVHEQPDSGLARRHQVQPAVLVEIHYLKLPAKGDLFFGSGDLMPCKFFGRAVPRVVIHEGRISGARVAAV